LTLLAAACPDIPPGTLAQLSIGQRDCRLLTLREWTFGSQLASLTTCPGCGERLELTFDVADIRVTTPPQGDNSDGSDGSPADGQEIREALSLNVADHEVHFRLPNSLDLAAMEGNQGATATRQVLLERCLLVTRRDGQEVTADQLPADVVAAVLGHMALADPQADVQLALSCPACEHGWQATFDILSFFWSEISAWAYRILREVHALASAYGWREADILTLSSWRRQLYLEMVSGS
jgi:hypothetical protein